MSDEIEITIDSNEITVESELIVDAISNNNIVNIEHSEPDVIVTFKKQEYVITGDDMYIPLSYDEAPQWLKNTITNITDLALNQKITDLNSLSNTLYGLIDELNVAKNTYTQSIISSADIDERINAKIETLNSSLSGSDATIVDLIATKATPTEASSLALNVLTASINNGAISSLVSNLQTAISTVNSAISTNIDIVHAEMTGEFEGTAEAIGVLRTYVGVSNDGGITGTGLLADLEILQKQNDGIIETTTGTYDVMINPQDPNLAQLVVAAKPYATWRAADVTGISNRLAHIGDVYIKYVNTANGAKEYVASYKFIRTVVDETSPYATDGDGFTWALIVDQAAQDAYEQALNAFDLADNKRRVFVATPFVPYDIGDLWLVQAGAAIIGTTQGGRVIQAGDMLRCSETKTATGLYENNDWIPADNYRESMDAIQTDLNSWRTGTYATFVTNIQTQVDGKAETFYQNSIPTGRIKSINVPNNITLNKYVGDLWKNIYVGTVGGYLGNNTEYVYTKTANGSNWNYDWTKMEVPDIVFDTIDTKKSIYSGNSVPVAITPDIIEINDMWIPSATNGSYLQGEIYQYSGSAWIVSTKYGADIEAVRSNLQSQVDGKVETYYQATVPDGMTSVNDGDYWYCTTDVSIYKKGKVYKYVHTTTSWTETADVSRYAFDTADGKAAIFLSTSTPTTGYKINDMLIVIGSFNNGTTTFSDGVVLSSNANRVSGFTASDWVKKINDTEDLDTFIDVTYNPTVSNLQSQVDSKIENWYAVSTSDPKTVWTDVETRNKHNGDLWYQIDTKNSYYYSSSTHSWNTLEDSKAIQALSAAATAQATADGVVVSYYAIKQNVAPATSNLWLNKTGTKVLKKYDTSWVNVSIKAGDTLTAYDPDTKDISIYVYNGSSWITNTENGIIATSEWGIDLNAYLDNKAVGGTSSLISDITATSNNNLSKAVNSRFAYNSNLVIDGVTYPSGFGLSNSTGTGVGSEFWIDASRLKFTNSAKTGSKAPFSIDASGATPQVSFNGVVSFTNITNVPTINKTYVQISQPTSGMNTGDTWIDSDDNNSLYSYNGTTWNKTQSGAKTYLQATAPTTGMITGDIWIDSDDNYKQYRYSGSAWVEYLYNPAAAINTGTTTINGPKITTGSITALQIAANSVTADKLIAGTNSSTVWTGGGLVSQNFNGNPYGNIGTPSTGFRLSSGAAGTSTDPNIYGAYIQGSSVEVNSFKVRAEGYASNFGRLNLVSGYTAIVGRGYSAGFDARRVCSDSVSSIKLDCWARATGNWISAVLEYEPNSSGNWILVADRGMSMYGYSEYAYLNFAEFFNPSLVPTTGYVHFRIRLTSGNSGSTSGVVVTLSNG